MLHSTLGTIGVHIKQVQTQGSRHIGRGQVKMDLEASVCLWKLLLRAFASIVSLKIGDPPALSHPFKSLYVSSPTASPWF